jgi:hypothetical protein
MGSGVGRVWEGIRLRGRQVLLTDQGRRLRFRDIFFAGRGAGFFAVDTFVTL